MALATSYNALQNPWIEYRFNVPVSTTDAQGVTTTQYQPLVMTARGQAQTADGGTRDVSAVKVVGTPQSSPLTNKQIYDQLGLVTTLHTQTRQLLKDLYTAAIATDISV